MIQVNLMVTTNQKPTKDLQKANRKKPKQNTKESQQTTREQIKRRSNRG